MPSKFLLLDKDGTVVRPASGNSFTKGPSDQALIPGAKPALEYYMGEEWIPVIVSNQGGVAAGHKSLKSAVEEMQFCMSLLPGIVFGLFCPDYGATIVGPKALGAQCFQVFPGSTEAVAIHEKHPHLTAFRKPQPGMLLAAMRLLQATDDDVVLMIGDMDSDEEAAAAANVPFTPAAMWLQEGLNLEFNKSDFRMPT